MKVKFVPQNIELEITSLETVKEVADRNNIFIKSICNGLPSCAECRVKIVEGESNVLPPNSKELNLIGTGYFIDGRRLSCQLHCFGDVTVDLSEQVEKQKHNTSRRPQGSKKLETEVTHAVSGNLIQQEGSVFDEIALQKPAEEESRKLEQNPNRDQHNKNHSKNPNSNQGSGSHQKRGQSQGRDQRQQFSKNLKQKQNQNQSDYQNRNDIQNPSRNQSKNENLSQNHNQSKYLNQNQNQNRSAGVNRGPGYSGSGNNMNNKENLNHVSGDRKGKPRKSFQYKPGQ